MRIVIITSCWPPRNAIGTFRPYSWAKFWSEAGCEITVLTSKKYAFDRPLDLNLPQLPNVNVIEVAYAAAGGWKQKLASSRFNGFLKKLYRKLKASGIEIKNPRDGWVDSAIKTAEDLAQAADVVVSTFTPEGSHLLGSVMKKANPDLIWVADYRDLWSLDHIHLKTKEEQHKLREHELFVMSDVDFITTVSEDLLYKQTELLNVSGAVVMNGYEDSVSEIKSRDKQSKCISNPVVISYTGRIYPGTRDPRPLLDCLVRMKKKNLLKDRMVEVHVYGDQVEYFEELKKEISYREFLFMKGYVTNTKSRQIQQQSDALLLLESANIDAKGVVTGKLFEYMASGTPVLSLGSKKNYAIGEIIDSTGIGIVAEDNQNEIEAFLIALIMGKDPVGRERSWKNIEMYSRECQARSMLEIIERLNGHG